MAVGRLVGREVEVPIPREDGISLGRDGLPSMREYIDEQIRLATFQSSRGSLQGTDFERFSQDSKINEGKLRLFYKKLYEKYLDTLTDEEIERILIEQGLTDADRRVVLSPRRDPINMFQTIIQGYKRVSNNFIFGLPPYDSPHVLPITHHGVLFYPEGGPRLITGGSFTHEHIQPYVNDLFRKYMRLDKKIDIVMRLLNKCCKSSIFTDLRNEMEDKGESNLFRSLFPENLSEDILLEASGSRKYRKTHKKKRSI